MSTDVDQILRTHADESARAVPPPDGWSRLEDRLADGDGALVVPIDPRPDRSTRRRTLWLAAAAALLVVVAAVGVLAATRDGEQSVDMSPVTQPPTTDAPPTSEAPTTGPTTAPTTAPTPDTTTTTEPPPELPGSIVGILDPEGDGVGDLVVLDADGNVTATLVESWVSTEVEEGGPRGPSALDVLPDGRVLYEMCCEPAAGRVSVVDPATGISEDVGDGRHPAISPDGARVAVSIRYDDDEIHLFDVAAPADDGGPLLAGGRPVIGATGDRSVSGLAWSPDGSTLAIETSRQTTGGETDPVVDVVDLASGGRQQVPGALDAAFLADGRLLVSTEAVPDGASWPQLVATSLAIVDPATGTSDPVLDDVRVVHLDATADGRWVLAVSGDGAVWALSAEDGADQGTVLSLDGLVAAVG